MPSSYRYLLKSFLNYDPLSVWIEFIVLLGIVSNNSLKQSLITQLFILSSNKKDHTYLEKWSLKLSK